MTGTHDRLNRQLPAVVNNTPIENLAAAKDGVERLGAVFAAECGSSQHSDVIAVLARLRHASIVLGRSLIRAHRIVDNIVALGDRIGVDPIRRQPTALSGTPLTLSSTAQGQAREADFDPQPYLDDMPVFVRDRRRRAKTHGRWPGAGGRTRVLVSGEHDGIYVRVSQRARDMGIIPSGSSLAAASDVELKVAQTMWETWVRTGIASSEILVINKPDGPCQGPFGCDSLLEWLLPPQGRLSVHWPGGRCRDYRGSAES